MRRDQLDLLACPACHGELAFADETDACAERVREGWLVCGCGERYPIRGSVPRFVPADNYANSFGLQWKQFAKLQHDEHSGLPLSETRFFESTRWPRELPAGERTLEVGCGSGRFTTHAAGCGGRLLSVDLSAAVEANYELNGHRDNLLIAQASAYALPVRPGSIDRAVCIGVVQHTPDPRQTVASIVDTLGPGGALAIDCYRKDLASFIKAKHYVRVITRRVPPRRLFKLVTAYINFMWPIACLLRKIPWFGVRINWMLCIPDYSRRGMVDPALKAWAVLDAIDMLAPTYDYPQTVGTIRRWLNELGLEQVEAHPGHNGVEGRGRKPA